VSMFPMVTGGASHLACRSQELYRATHIPGPKQLTGMRYEDSLVLLEYLGLADESAVATAAAGDNTADEMQVG
jgi:hypothetical protein